MMCRDFIIILIVILYLVMVAQIVQELSILYDRIQQLHN